jgi:prevent-host-death family protein
MTILVIMKNIPVTELKARLSQYLRAVRMGEEVQVLDRGVPVARLVPILEIEKGGDEAARDRLIQEGVLRGGTGFSPALLEEAPFQIPGGFADSLESEREDRL